MLIKSSCEYLKNIYKCFLSLSSLFFDKSNNVYPPFTFAVSSLSSHRSSPFLFFKPIALCILSKRVRVTLINGFTRKFLIGATTYFIIILLHFANFLFLLRFFFQTIFHFTCLTINIFNLTTVLILL